MAELVVRFDVRFSRASARWWLAAVMLLAAAPELGSESVTLTTYYPAPSGIYTSFITTGDTRLARDGNVVRVGSNPATAANVLTVNGYASAGKVNGGSYNPLTGDVNAYSMEIGGPNPTAGNGQATFFLHHHGVIANQLRYRNGTLFLEAAGNGYGTTATPTFQSTGDLVASRDVRGVHAIGTDATCVATTFNATGVTTCPGNNYVTFQSGVISRLVVVQPIEGNTNIGTMLCCTCPATGCPF